MGARRIKRIFFCLSDQIITIPCCGFTTEIHRRNCTSAEMEGTLRTGPTVSELLEILHLDLGGGLMYHGSLGDLDALGQAVGLPKLRPLVLCAMNLSGLFHVDEEVDPEEHGFSLYSSFETHEFAWESESEPDRGDGTARLWQRLSASGAQEVLESKGIYNVKHGWRLAEELHEALPTRAHMLALSRLMGSVDEVLYRVHELLGASPNPADQARVLPELGASLKALAKVRHGMAGGGGGFGIWFDCTAEHMIETAAEFDRRLAAARERAAKHATPHVHVLARHNEFLVVNLSWLAFGAGKTLQEFFGGLLSFQQALLLLMQWQEALKRLARQELKRERGV